MAVSPDSMTASVPSDDVALPGDLRPRRQDVAFFAVVGRRRLGCVAAARVQTGVIVLSSAAGVSVALPRRGSKPASSLPSGDASGPTPAPTWITQTVVSEGNPVVVRQ